MKNITKDTWKTLQNKIDEAKEILEGLPKDDDISTIMMLGSVRGKLPPIGEELNAMEMNVLSIKGEKQIKDWREEVSDIWGGIADRVSTLHKGRKNKIDYNLC